MRSLSTFVAVMMMMIALAGLVLGCGSGLAPDGDAGDEAPSPLGSITGTVTVGGEPAQGVDVIAQMDTGIPLGDAMQYSATSDATGGFVIGDLAPGLYSVAATVGDQAGIRPGVEVWARAATPITVDLVATGTLSGKVRKGGAAVGNGGIMVWVPNTPLTAICSDDGSYALIAPTSTTSIMAHYPGFSVGQKTGLVVTAGETTSVSDLSILRTANTIPQIATISANPFQVQGSGTSTIAIAATDSDGDTLSHAWSATSGSVSGSGASVTYTAPAGNGTYLVTCIVNDGVGGVASGAVAVVVSNPAPPNSAPSVSSVVSSVSDAAPGATGITITATASDADTDNLVCTWSATGGTITGSGGAISGGSGTNPITWTAPQVVGTYSIFCTVSDGRGGVAQNGTTVTVSETEIAIW